MAIVIPVDTDTSQAESSLDRLKRHAKDAADKVKGSFKGTADGFEDLGDAIGLPVDKVKKLGGAMSLLATPAGAVGVAVAAVAVSLAAAGIAAVGFVSGVVSLTESAAAALPKLQALSEASGVALVSDEAADSINAAKASLDAMGASVSAVGASLAAQFAPYVEQAATLVTGVVLALKSWLDTNPGFISGVMKIGEVLVNSFFTPLRAGVFAIGALLESAGMLSEALGLDFAQKLRDVGQAMLGWSIAGPVAGSINMLTTATAEYHAEAKSLVKAQKELNAETKEGEESADDLAAGVAAAIAKLGDLFDNTAQAQAEANAAMEDIYDKAEQIPGVYDDILLGAEAVKQATKDWNAELAVATDALNNAASGADGIMAMVSSSGPWGAAIAAIVGFIKDFDETLASFHDFHMDLFETIGEIPTILAEAAPAAFTDGMIAAITAIPDFVDALVEAMPVIIMALVESAYPIAEALVKSIVKLVFVSLPKIGDSLVDGIVDAMLRIFNPELNRAWQEAYTRWANGVDDQIKEWVQAFWDEVKAIFDFGELVSGGSSDSAKMSRREQAGEIIKFVATGGLSAVYSDTPNVVNAGPQGMTARFAPNDRVAASRTNEGLLAQVLDLVGVSPTSSPMMAPAPAYINWADGHRGFDSFFVRHAALGGRTASFINRKTGRG